MHLRTYERLKGSGLECIKIGMIDGHMILGESEFRPTGRARGERRYGYKLEHNTHIRHRHRIASKVSIDVTLLPRMTCVNGQYGELQTRGLGAKATHDSANWVLLGGRCLLQRVVEDEVQKQVITAQHSADLAASLKMDEQLLVHELG